MNDFISLYRVKIGNNINSQKEKKFINCFKMLEIFKDNF